jgi:hypothetical protein
MLRMRLCMLTSSHGVRKRLVEALRGDIARTIVLPILWMTAMRRGVLQVFWWRRSDFYLPTKGKGGVDFALINGKGILRSNNLLNHI